jgi:hypothetical protein
MDGFLDRAMLKMEMHDNPLSTPDIKARMINLAKENLREAYRYTWNQPSVRSAGACVRAFADRRVAGVCCRRAATL